MVKFGALAEYSVNQDEGLKVRVRIIESLDQFISLLSGKAGMESLNPDVQMLQYGFRNPGRDRDVLHD